MCSPRAFHYVWVNRPTVPTLLRCPCIVRDCIRVARRQCSVCALSALLVRTETRKGHHRQGRLLSWAVPCLPQQTAAAAGESLSSWVVAERGRQAARTWQVTFARSASRITNPREGGRQGALTQTTFHPATSTTVFALSPFAGTRTFPAHGQATDRLGTCCASHQLHR